MKFQLVKDKKDKENIIELWLEDISDGEISLMGTSGGDEKYLMTFKDGKFERCTDADLEGLETDSTGRIKEKE